MSERSHATEDHLKEQSRFVSTSSRLLIDDPPLLALLYCLLEVVGFDDSASINETAQTSIDHEQPAPSFNPIYASPPTPDKKNLLGQRPADSSDKRKLPTGKTARHALGHSHPTFVGEVQPSWFRHNLTHFSVSANYRSHALRFDFRELVIRLQNLVDRCAIAQDQFQWVAIDINNQTMKIHGSLFRPRTEKNFDETWFCPIVSSKPRVDKKVKRHIGLSITHPTANLLIARQIEHAGFTLSGAHLNGQARIREVHNHARTDPRSTFSARRETLNLKSIAHSSELENDLAGIFADVQAYLDVLETKGLQTKPSCVIFGPRDLNTARLANDMRRAGIRTRLAQVALTKSSMPSVDEIVFIHALETEISHWPLGLLNLLHQHPTLWLIPPRSATSRKTLDLLIEKRPANLPSPIILYEANEGTLLRTLVAAQKSETLPKPTESNNQTFAHQLKVGERVALARYIGGLAIALASSNQRRVELLLHQMAGWLGLVDDAVLPSGFKAEVISLYRRSQRSDAALIRIINRGASWVIPWGPVSQSRIP